MSCIEVNKINISAEEEAGIKELKYRLRDKLKPKYLDERELFLRFLRARNLNLDKSEDMLRNHLEWRETHKVDDISFWKRPEVAKYFPSTHIGFSKSGNPIRYINFGNMDSKGLLKCARKIDCVLTVVQILESDEDKMKEHSLEIDKHISQWIYIFDFDNYSFAKATHKPTVQMVAQLMMTYEAHYPERLKEAIIINASIYFTIIFAVVKPLFTGATLTKIKIFGKDGWKNEILKDVDPDIIPKFLGGNRTDPDGDPKCHSTVNHGGLVPEFLYGRNNNLRLCHQPEVKKLHVSRMSKVDVELYVAEAGSHIEWEFETENKDIGFGLYFKGIDCNKGNLTELVPKQRVEAHVTSEIGMYTCNFPGTYILVFDNTYSWLQQKEVFCRAAVVMPTGEKIHCL